MLSKDESKETAWQKVAEGGDVEIVKRLWEWVKELQLKPKELRNDVYCQKTRKETAWHKAAEGGHVEIFEETMGWGL